MLQSLLTIFEILIIIDSLIRTIDATDIDIPVTQDTIYEALVGCNDEAGRSAEGHMEKLLELDIMEDPTGNRRKRAAVLNSNWPGGVVPYIIHSDIYHYTPIIMKAFEAIQNQTCVTFVPRRNSSRYIHIRNFGGCWSYVGLQAQKGRGQILSLGRGCGRIGIVIHELLHVLGFHHEQTRPDRDNYITVVRNNIKPSEFSNFDKMSLANWDEHGTPYDYNSVMHYSEGAFARRRGLITMRTKDPAFQKVIGGKDQLSEMDVFQLKIMYGVECPLFTRPILVDKILNQLKDLSRELDDRLKRRVVKARTQKGEEVGPAAGYHSHISYFHVAVSILIM